jgi:putative flippase GtrA
MAYRAVGRFDKALLSRVEGLTTGLPRKYRGLFQQGFQYAVVGLLGAVLHLGMITLGMELVGLPYWAGFVLALPFPYSTKFLLNKYWTFK